MSDLTLQGMFNPNNFYDSGFLVKIPPKIFDLANSSPFFGLILGLLLSIHYATDVGAALDTVSHIMRDVNFEWSLSITPANGASFFLLCLYIYIVRKLSYTSYYFFYIWMVGMLILLTIMAATSLGHVLPWEQMFSWGITVITNLFSLILIIEAEVVYWLREEFTMDNAVLSRFCSLHFLLPFVVVDLVIIHLIFLYKSGSSNFWGLGTKVSKIILQPYFMEKTLLGVYSLIIFSSWAWFCASWMLEGSENLISANPLTLPPLQPQPDWYFNITYASTYTILRPILNHLYTLDMFLKDKMKFNFCNAFLKLVSWGYANIVFVSVLLKIFPVEPSDLFVGV